MAYDLKDKLVITIASSALFDLSESDEIFRKEGEKRYNEFQKKNENVFLEKGIAFPFVERLLRINEMRQSEGEEKLVEVMLLSRNSPLTGLRVMNSIEEYGLEISRAIFLEGRDPYIYIPALKSELFLSADQNDVENAVGLGYPAGRILESNVFDEEDQRTLRIAFDFDGVVIDDTSEKVYANEGMIGFQQHELINVDVAHDPGPLDAFLQKLSYIQQLEEEYKVNNPEYKKILDISIVTARNAPADKRVMTTLQEKGLIVNRAYFLGGIEKKTVLEILKPHLFFDDQMGHLKEAMTTIPCVHIPYGIKNKKREDDDEQSKEVEN